MQREKPNLYQKARIANRMKWALMEAKYPKRFVDGLAYALATVVAARQLAARGLMLRRHARPRRRRRPPPPRS